MNIYVKRKNVLKISTGLFVLVFLLFVFQICIPERETYDSFENFMYPTESNLYDILHSENASSFEILINYKPNIINTIKNVTDVKVVIIVKSAISNIQNRDKIRQTWASKACQKTHNLQVLFSLGQTNGKTNCSNIEKEISEESRKYQDILRFNFVDVYLNNTLKVMAILNHFVRFYLHVPYLLITDDDFFINPSKLIHLIDYQISKFQYERYFGGFVWYHNTPQRRPFLKWYVNKESYRFDYYPPYVPGGFILMSYPMAKVCDKLLPFLQYNSIDDVLLGILLFKLNIYPIQIKNVFPIRPKILPKDILACHSMFTDLIEFWQKNNYQNKC